MNKLERICLLGAMSAFMLAFTGGCSEANNNLERKNEQLSSARKVTQEDSSVFFHKRGLSSLRMRTYSSIEQAIDDFERAREGYERNENYTGLVGVNASLGTAYFMIGKYQEAISPLKLALEINEEKGFHFDTQPDKEMHLVRLYLGISYFKTGDFENAFNTFYTANLFYPENKEILAWYSKAARSFIKELKTQINGESDSAKLEILHAKLGDAYLKAGELKLANQQALLIQKLNPNSVDALRLLGQISFEQRDWNNAKHYFQQILESGPDEHAYHELGAAYLNSGDLNKALVVLEEGINLFPNSPRMNFVLGLAYDRAGRRDDATRCFEIACSTMPERREYCNPPRIGGHKK
ncbi:MAG: hypothetical protein D6797_08135 [Bdellovibrio sp.]|nr:MAG: hypothetical protein D6797_08135 [Bdellovibrio sp.]